VTLFVVKKEPSKARVGLDAGIVGEMGFEKGCQLNDCACCLETKCTSESNEVVLALV
jgi:hypothetical protein